MAVVYENTAGDTEFNAIAQNRLETFGAALLDNFAVNKHGSAIAEGGLVVMEAGAEFTDDMALRPFLGIGYIVIKRMSCHNAVLVLFGGAAYTDAAEIEALADFHQRASTAELRSWLMHKATNATCNRSD